MTFPLRDCLSIPPPFRLIDESSLPQNPFRMFTSIAAPQLIEDISVRAEASRILSQRRIFTPRALELIRTAEIEGGLTETEAEEFLREVVPTFRWHRSLS